MQKYIFTILTLVTFFLLPCKGQEKITDRLQQTKWGEGTVIIHQDERLYHLIGTIQDATQVVQIKGYRIQIFAGDNTRSAREAATAAASTIKRHWPDMPIYTEFIAPRWVCRIGDFKSYEEADAQLRDIRKAGLFRDATILPNQLINITY